jgi:hypothetical protein
MAIAVTTAVHAYPEESGTVPEQTGLLKECMLHPFDIPTAYTLARGEVVYNQALQPWPTWGFWGVTDRMTAELDFEAWLGGVPSLNFRYRLMDRKGAIPTLAWETMYQYVGQQCDLLADDDEYDVERRGNSWYNKINGSWSISDRLSIHLSGGATYSEFLRLEKKSTGGNSSKEYHNIFAPDVASGIDWRAAKWLVLTGGQIFFYLSSVHLFQSFEDLINFDKILILY